MAIPRSRPFRGLLGWRRDALRSARLRAFVCWLVHLYIRFVYRTNRWTTEGGDEARALCAARRPFILAFWHGRLLMIPMAWRRMAPMHMLISAHPDGRIIADAVAHFGVGSIAGSTRRGGSAALRMMLKRLKEGDCVGITPDGPRGPAMTASTGIVNLARLARMPIVPITYATSRRRVLKTWDRFHLACPFGRGIFLWGEPIMVASDCDAAGLEVARCLVETRMVGMVQDADRRMGHRTAGVRPEDKLVPGIHAVQSPEPAQDAPERRRGMDGRDRSGHDLLEGTSDSGDRPRRSVARRA
jgi:lysophospholipid acyltransferase (LPLAT)-like uncharacterized protein